VSESPFPPIWVTNELEARAQLNEMGSLRKDETLYAVLSFYVTREKSGPPNAKLYRLCPVEAE
jgi:hypothetical protein